MKLDTRNRLLASTLLVSAALIAQPAFAQAAAGTDAAQAVDKVPSGVQTQGTVAAAGGQEADNSGEIVVTGSLIKNANLVQSSPVTVIGQDEVNLRQSNVAEEILRTIPGVVPSIGSAVNNGNGGQSFVNLKGLGSNRNIVLLDGNRIVPGDLTGRVDLNNIPLALIERSEVLTGGASTTYGADAISGVVNFITRSDFSGVEVNASQQLTQKGDGNVFRTDVTIGANFDDGRGNAVFSVGYQQADPVFQGDRGFAASQFDSFTGAVSGSGTGIPSRISGTRPLVGGVPNTIAAFNQTGFTVAGARDPDGNLIPVGTPILAGNAAGAANGGVRQVNAAGQAVGTFAPFNFNPYNVFQTPFERFNMFGSAHYELSDGLEVYTKGLFSKNTVSTIIAPSGVFGSTVTTNLNNPYLPAALRNQFCALNVAPSVNGVNAQNVATSGQVAYTPLYTPAQCAAAAVATGPSDPNYRTVTTTVNRRTTEVGPRISDYVSTVFDYRAGLRGDITDKIGFDISGAYGESENQQTLQGYVLTSRVRQAALANNTTTCITDTNGCVPINLFGPEGSISADQIPFITGESTSTVRTSLAQARAVVNGELGFASPLATQSIGFAAGGEFRKYTAQQRSDILAQTAGELGGAGGAQPNIDGGYSVYEGFAEIIAPLIEDQPFFHSLTVEGGVRRSHYEVDAPGKPTFNTTTWKAGGTWEPVASLKVRGNYSRAVRAPNIGELFSPISTGLTNLSVDPCSGNLPVGNAALTAVCIAQGAPVNSIGDIINDSAGQINVTGGGNPQVGPEKSNSYTIGTVFQPTFLRGFNITVDYYNIKISGAITSPTPADLISACFSAPSTSNAACTVIGRNPSTGALFGDPATTRGLFAPLSNLGRLKTDGIDLVANYRTDVGFGVLNLSFSGNWTNTSSFQATPTSLNRECTGLYSTNCGSLQPEFSWSTRSTLTVGPADFSVLWRHIDSMKQEPDDVANGNGPGYSGAVTGFGSRNFGRIKAYNYIDFTTRFGASDNLDLTVTVQNLFNKQPPIVGNTIGSTTYNSGNTYPSTYDALGRRFAVGARLKF